MTEISAKLVKELRDRTGAGMMECKRALVETNGDIDAAVELLRKWGAASAEKRAGRDTTEGIVLSRVENGLGAIVGVGCETEPVSKNEEFRAFAERVLATTFDGGDSEALEDRREHRRSRDGQIRGRRRRRYRCLRPPACEQARGARAGPGWVAGPWPATRDAYRRVQSPLDRSRGRAWRHRDVRARDLPQLRRGAG